MSSCEGLLTLRRLRRCAPTGASKIGRPSGWPSPINRKSRSSSGSDASKSARSAMKGHYCTVRRITENVVQRNGTIEKRRLVTYACSTHALPASNEVHGMIESTGNVPAYADALAHLGEANSRSRIATPALLCDVALLVSNIERMADEARASGVSLRPHLKSHKSAFILELQLKAGACGVACAKLGEAEAIIEARGNEAARLSVLLTSPLVGHHAATRGEVSK